MGKRTLEKRFQERVTIIIIKRKNKHLQETYKPILGKFFKYMSFIKKIKNHKSERYTTKTYLSFRINLIFG